MNSKNMQTTLKRKVSLSGIGLHAGKRVNCTLHPAPANHGIVFLRSDLKGSISIKADISRVIRTDMSTTIGSNDALVATIEHLMAAFRGMGIDNALVELDAPEVPIMDGSSREFALAIADAGTLTLAAPKKVIRLKKTIGVRAGDKYVVAKPSKELSIQGTIEFGHQMIGKQSFNFSSSANFLSDLSGARTFGFLREVEYLHKKGLALGGSLANAVVLDEARVLNPEGLRYQNEFVRHKVLDALGDFALVGLELQADIEIFKSGHEMHAGFIGKILEDPANYEIVQLTPVEAYEEEEEDDLLPLLATAY